PSAVEATVEALYDLSIDIVAQDIFEREPAAATAWSVLLPRLAPALAQRPRALAAAITNAAVAVAATPGARPRAWIATMVRVARASADPGVVLAAGRVAAWRAGLAALRAEALAAAEALPETVARAALGLPTGEGAPRTAVV